MLMFAVMLWLKNIQGYTLIDRALFGIMEIVDVAKYQERPFLENVSQVINNDLRYIQVTSGSMGEV